MTDQQLQQTLRRTARSLRVGSVSYLNAKPLIYGLDTQPDLELLLDLPANLLSGLDEGRFDVALLPVIDYQRRSGLQLLPVGGIGSDGTTLTVRIFSRKPIGDIDELACDIDSHTSVALATLILTERNGKRPRIVDLDTRSAGGLETTADAILLIGDKVVSDEPTGWPHQLDLGAAWKELTGLPFVFACWTVRENVELGDLPARLTVARKAGLANLPRIVREHAEPRGWPPDLAMQYLRDYLRFEIGPRELEAIQLFHHKAAEQGLIPREQPLVIYPGK